MEATRTRCIPPRMTQLQGTLLQSRPAKVIEVADTPAGVSVQVEHGHVG